jgi:hypothetical protein
MHLRGPANDVVLLRDVLVHTFGFPEANIVTLAEGVGGEERRPTRKNIEREFVTLRDSVGPGDQVVVLLSGHGSRQPEKDPLPNPRFAQPDGMNELFLPADIGKWNGTDQTVANAILDQDIRVWTDAIVSKGASLWLIADCCHSGDLIRGNEVVREVLPRHLGIPEPAIQKAKKKAEGRFGVVRGEGKRQRIDEKGKPLAAIYACQPYEVTVERTMADRKEYGLLTYTLCQILERTQNTRGRLTYRGLVQRINAEYHSQTRNFPTTLVDGPDADLKILGMERGPVRRLVLRQQGKEDRTINAGVLHGLTTGSILAVYPPAGAANADTPLGHVVIVRARPLRSEVEPCSYPNRGGPKPDGLRDGCPCEPVFFEYGDLRLKVGMDQASAPGQAPGGADGRRLQQELKKLAADKEHPLVELVEPQQASWLVRLREDRQVELLPAEGISLSAGQNRKEGPGPRFGPFPVDGSLAGELGKHLSRIARAKNLLRLAGAGDPGQQISRMKMDIEMLRLRDEDDPRGQPIQWQTEDLSLQAGDLIKLRVHNLNDFGVYPTLLFIDSEYHITPWYPDVSEPIKKLGEGKVLEVESFRINKKTVGQEYMVLIAVKGEGEPVDFSILAEETAAGAGTAVKKKGGSDPFKSPLGELYQSALYGKGNRKGIERAQIGSHILRLITWKTKATPSP